MDQETHNNLEGFENASGPSTTPSPTLHNLVELIATQSDLLLNFFKDNKQLSSHYSNSSTNRVGTLSTNLRL